MKFLCPICAERTMEQMPDADKEDALLVSITRDGKVYFGSEQIQDVDGLTTKVKDRFASKPGDHRVYVKADMRTRFGGVVRVVDAVRAAGVDDLGLLTDQRKTSPTTPPPAGTGQGQPEWTRHRAARFMEVG